MDRMSHQPERPLAKTPPPNSDSHSSDAAESHYHLRYALDSFVTLSRCGPSGTSTLSGVVIEISAVGMSAIVPESLQFGEKVSLNVELIVETLTIDGVVQYSHKFRHGFRFVDMNSHQRTQIDEACARLRVYCRDRGDCIEWSELHRRHPSHSGNAPIERIRSALRFLRPEE